MRRPFPALLCAALLAGGCTHVLPPPATPAAVVPDMAQAPPLPEGQGRLVLDVVDGPTPVSRVADTTVTLDVGKGDTLSATARSTTPLCTTPCVADMAPGQYMLAFPTHGGTHRLQLAAVDVTTQPTVYRRALGTHDPGGAGLVLGILGVTFGGASFITGATLLPIGLANDDGGMSLAGGITLGVGAVLTAVGILAIESDPTIDRPGSSVQFPLPGSDSTPASDGSTPPADAATPPADAATPPTMKAPSATPPTTGPDATPPTPAPSTP